MTDFTEKFKELITPYIGRYSEKSRTIGRLARAWQTFETNGSDEELRKRLEQIANVWKRRTDQDLASYDSVEEYLASKRSDAKKIPWKIFTELDLYRPPTKEELEELQRTAAEDAEDTLQTVDDTVEKNFRAEETVVLDQDGGFIYVYHYPDELSNYNLIKQKAPHLLLEAKRPRYKVGKAKNTVGAESRVKGQIGTSIHQVMQIALVIQIRDESKIEAIIHNILEWRQRKCPDSVGEEWFFTSPEEVHGIIDLIRGNSAGSNPSQAPARGLDKLIEHSD